MSSTALKSTKRKVQSVHRPRSVTIVAWLHILQSLALLIFAYFLFNRPSLPSDNLDLAFRFLPFALFEPMLNGAVLVVLAVMGIGIALALLRLRPWAWLAAMTLQGLGLLAALYSYVNDRPNYYVGMLIGIFLVFYLNQREVQEAFRQWELLDLYQVEEDPTEGVEG